MITDYASLQARAAKYLNRGDLTDDLPTFVQLAERRLATDIESSPAVATENVSAGAASLILAPTYGVVRALAWRRNGRDEPVMADLRVNATGRTEVFFDPIPLAASVLVVEHEPALVPLSNANPSNAVLAQAPNAYLYAVLLEATPYLMEDERIPTWGAAYQTAVDGYNALVARKLFASRPVPLPYAGFG